MNLNKLKLAILIKQRKQLSCCESKKYVYWDKIVKLKIAKRACFIMLVTDVRSDNYSMWLSRRHYKFKWSEQNFGK